MSISEGSASAAGSAAGAEEVPEVAYLRFRMVNGSSRGAEVTIPCNKDTVMTDIANDINRMFNVLSPSNVSVDEFDELVPRNYPFLCVMGRALFCLDEGFLTTGQHGDLPAVYLLPLKQTIPILMLTWDRIRLRLRTTTGRLLSLVVPRTLTVLELKKKLEREVNIIPSKLEALFKFRSLQNNRTLFSYNVVHNSVVNLSRRAEDNEMEDEVQRELAWPRDVPRWRYYYPGLCAEGMCENPHCPASGRHVIGNFEMGFFETPRLRPTCPLCREIISFTKLAVNKCIYRMRSIEKDTVIQKSRGWTRVEEYEVLLDTVFPVMDFGYIEIEAHSGKEQDLFPTTVGSNIKLVPKPKICALCCDYILTDDECEILECAHGFHSRCWRAWKSDSTLIEGTYTCPVCKELVAENLCRCSR